MTRGGLRVSPQRREDMQAIRKQECVEVQVILTPKELEAYKAYDPKIREKFDTIVNKLSRRKVGATYIVPKLTYENPKGGSVVELKAYFD